MHEGDKITADLDDFDTSVKTKHEFYAREEAVCCRMIKKKLKNSIYIKGGQ
jgi:hypothetical protein